MRIIQSPSPNFNARPVAIDTIIIHYTDMLSMDDTLAWLTNPASKVSAHYLIGKKGDIYHMVDEEHRAWHAGESFWQGRSNVNDYSIGIELSNPGHTHGYQPFPEPQIEALIELCLDIQKRWQIPQNRILGHSDIAPGRKQDPGHLFPWERLANEGLGMWPKDVENLNAPSPVHSLREFTTSPTRGEVYVKDSLNTEHWTLNTGLSQLGYDITSPTHTLLAFQRHFQSHKVDGVADQETYALLQGLLKSQEMLI